MRSGSRKNRPLRAFTLLLLLGAVAFAAGCSTAQSPGGSGTNVNHILPSGSSVAGWMVAPAGGSHARTATLDYIAGGGNSGCTQCHGSDLTGGISRVSCFGNPAGCHHVPVAGWVAPPPGVQNHGVSAKKAPGNSGFAGCQICHGKDFSGGGAQTACSSCHGVSAPHPAQPWRGPTYTHVDTDDSNAAVCAQCHFPGSSNNPPNHPPTPAPAGTPPGCFNSTLCHGEATVPHPVGSAWVATSPAAQPHANDAKATPGATTGFTYCQACHGTGTDFAGGSSGVSCYPCHSTSANAPHASQWRTGDTYVHTTTAEGNAAVCAFCHLNGANSPVPPPSPPAPAGTTPGCFNNTLCHGAGGAPHPVGSAWVATSPAAQPHGNSAKATPGATAGYAYCQVCHGTGTTPPANFGGGSSGVSCLTCHGNPHAPAPWRASAGSVYNHTSTDPGNAPICQQCHFPGSLANPPNHPPTPAPAGTPAGCFNNTLCHNGGSGAPHPVPFNDTSHFTVTAATFPANCSACHDVSAPSTKSGPACQTCHVAGSPLAALTCTSCHASPPSGGAPAGAAYPNIPGAHAPHLALNSAGSPVACNTCHNGLGSGTLNHYNRAKARVTPGDAAFPATYNAQTGASSFDNSAALSCSNVSCHGGQATPNWQTGALNVNAQCTSCHSQGTAQFNSYNSGDHGINSSHSLCTNCHNTTTLAVNHFTNLSTTAMEGPASATIGGAGTLIPAGNYNTVTRSCTPSCHGNETW